MEKKYKRLETLRKQVKNNKRSMEYYNWLKEYNKKDQLYGWMFENDAILNDTLEDLDLYQESYIIDILTCYIGELETIIYKTQKGGNFNEI